MNKSSPNTLRSNSPSNQSLNVERLNAADPQEVPNNVTDAAAPQEVPNKYSQFDDLNEDLTLLMEQINKKLKDKLVCEAVDSNERKAFFTNANKSIEIIRKYIKAMRESYVRLKSPEYFNLLQNKGKKSMNADGERCLEIIKDISEAIRPDGTLSLENKESLGKLTDLMEDNCNFFESQGNIGRKYTKEEMLENLKKGTFSDGSSHKSITHPVFFFKANPMFEDVLDFYTRIHLEYSINMTKGTDALKAMTNFLQELEKSCSVQESKAKSELNKLLPRQL